MLDTASFDHKDIDYSLLYSATRRWQRYAQTHPQELAARIADAEIIVTNKVPINKHDLQSAPLLKLICIAATGTNYFDIEAAQASGITVCNVKDYATNSVTQHVIGLMLSLARRLCDYSTAVNNGHWSHAQQFCMLDYPIEELNEKTLGIIGYGVLGQSVAKVAAALGMNVLIAERRGVQPRPQRIGFNEMLKQADIISLHCPLTTDTKKLIGEAELSQMKHTAWVINTARGELIDEIALANALDHGQIGAAALDVLSTEPPPQNHPLLTKPRPNLFITPHVAWASRTARQHLLDEVAANIQAYFSGHPQNTV
jgi:glycerate dehydrogenase